MNPYMSSPGSEHQSPTIPLLMASSALESQLNSPNQSMILNTSNSTPLSFASSDIGFDSPLFSDTAYLEPPNLSEGKEYQRKYSRSFDGNGFLMNQYYSTEGDDLDMYKTEVSLQLFFRTTVRSPLLVLRFSKQLCRTFLNKGECQYQESCLFAHGLGELRPRRFSSMSFSRFLRDPLACQPSHVALLSVKYKTEPCENFKSGQCKFGNKWLERSSFSLF
jgi:hypothetical protein